MNLNLIYNSWLFNNLTYFWWRGLIYLKNCLTYFYKLFIDAERVNASVKQCDVFIFPDFYGIYFEKYCVRFFRWMKRQRGKPKVTYVLWMLFVKIMTYDEKKFIADCNWQKEVAFSGLCDVLYVILAMRRASTFFPTK